MQARQRAAYRMTASTHFPGPALSENLRMQRPVRPAPLLALTFACLASAASAEAPVRGLLRYADGTVLPGLRVEQSGAGGLLRSERFGDIRYTDAEARFEPAEGVAPAAAPALAAVPVAAARAPWQPERWSVGLSGYWQSSNGTKESDAAIDVDATWVTPRNDINLRLSTDYRINSDTVDNNEQSGRLRWVRSLSTPWVALGVLRAHRNTFTFDSLPTFDYLLLQGTLGLGAQKKWPGDGKTLVALGYDWVSLDLLDYGARTSTHATSLLIENSVPLTPKITFDQTLYFYLWQGGDTGIDSQAELSYAITESLRVGLKHELRRNAVDLDVGTYSKFSVTTRVRF